MAEKRPPIVTVLGHVDHGKTSLLDALRGSNVAAREAGGITQGIGASTLKTTEGEITFIDTPGHAAFSNMRQRGSKVADIVLLVVAADDGVKPQTEEALHYIKETETPYIVVFNKIDLPSANVDKAKGELMEREVLFEGLGGDTPSVEVSAKKKEGLKELLEMIFLLYEVNEMANMEDKLIGYVIESNKNKGGVAASVIVKNGVLRVGEEINSDGKQAKVKGIFDENNKPIREIKAGYAGLVLGFSELPLAGSEVYRGSRLDSLHAHIQQDKENVEIGDSEVGVLIKASSAGKLEAILASLPKGVIVTDSGVGEVTDSDVFMAKSTDSEILTFELKIANGIKKLTDTEGVKITNFKVIYEMFEHAQKLLDEKKIKYKGKAEVVAIFPFNNSKVAGCKIIEGEIKVGDGLKIIRNEKEIGKVKITSLRRGKEELGVAKSGEECGILFKPQLDFNEGDVLLSEVK